MKVYRPQFSITLFSNRLVTDITAHLPAFTTLCFPQTTLLSVSACGMVRKTVDVPLKQHSYRSS